MGELFFIRAFLIFTVDILCFAKRGEGEKGRSGEALSLQALAWLASYFASLNVVKELKRRAMIS